MVLPMSLNIWCSRVQDRAIRVRSKIDRGRGRGHQRLDCTRSDGFLWPHFGQGRVPSRRTSRRFLARSAPRRRASRTRKDGHSLQSSAKPPILLTMSFTIICSKPRFQASRSADRSWAVARPWRKLRPRIAETGSATNSSPRGSFSRQAGRLSHQKCLRSPSACSATWRIGRVFRSAGRNSPAGSETTAANLNRRIGVWGSQALRIRSKSSCAFDVRPGPWRRNVLAPVSGASRREGARLFSKCLAAGLL